MKEYDVASWHATDAFLELHPPEGSTRYYLAKKTDGVWTVVFGKLNDAHDRFLIPYEAVQGVSPEEFKVVTHDPPLEDTGFYLAAARAMDKALADFPHEERSYNSYALPAADGQFYLYLLPATNRDGLYLLGGDIRYLFSADGSQILDRHAMHTTILEFDASQKPEEAKTLQAGMHTHVLSDCPEDSDVFYVLNRQPAIPEYVGSMEKKVYVIQIDGSISRVK